MLKAIQDFYSNYANFKGRTGLRPYRFVIIYNFLGWFGLAIASTLILNLTFSWLYTVGAWLLFHAVPLSAIQTRRMHDLNQSGASTLMIGAGVRLFWERGTKGENQYGPEPTD